MKNTNLHNKNYIEEEFFSSAETKYEKSKADIWNDIISKIDNPHETSSELRKTTPLQLRVFYGIAACIILLLGTTLMLRFYSTSNYCPDGKQLTVNLPDGSTVSMQSNSTITYYPLWWKFSRRIVLTGEAFFDVKTGNEFRVSSPRGSTIVLGTSFNIFASNYEYKVTCFTGKVKVVSAHERSVILSPDYSAEITPSGEIKVSKYIPESGLLIDENNMFDYSSVPLSKVIVDIEDHYNITITSSTGLNYKYTGFFSKHKSVEDVLVLLCKPYGLTFVVLSDNKYHIIKN